MNSRFLISSSFLLLLVLLISGGVQGVIRQRGNPSSATTDVDAETFSQEEGEVEAEGGEDAPPVISVEVIQQETVEQPPQQESDSGVMETKELHQDVGSDNSSSPPPTVTAYLSVATISAAVAAMLYC